MTFDEWYENHDFNVADPEGRDLAREAWGAAQMADAESIADMLNHLKELDHESAKKFIQLSVPVNQEVARDPYIEVRAHEEAEGFTSDFRMRPLGFLNGLCTEDKWVCATYDADSEELLGFDAIDVSDVQY